MNKYFWKGLAIVVSGFIMVVISVFARQPFINAGKIANNKEKITVVEVKQETHWEELLRRMDSIEGKLDKLNGD